MKHLNTFFTALLVFVLTAMAATARPGSVEFADPPAYLVEILSKPFDEMATVNLSGLNADEWTAVSDVIDDYVSSADDETRAYGLRTILLFSDKHGADVDFSDTSWDLYQIYRFSPNHAHRLMAIAALSKVGTENVMRHVAHNIGAIESRQLRHVAKAAVNGFFVETNQ